MPHFFLSHMAGIQRGYLQRLISALWFVFKLCKSEHCFVVFFIAAYQIGCDAVDVVRKYLFLLIKSQEIPTRPLKVWCVHCIQRKFDDKVHFPYECYLTIKTILNKEQQRGLRTPLFNMNMINLNEEAPHIHT